jgi:uncharacterized protein YukE
MPESFAGITVPEGEPGGVRDAAATFRSLAGGLHGVSGELRGVPGLVADWKGIAATAFHGTVPTNGSCVDNAAEAMSTCAQAARTYADELEAAQKEAEAAIEEARDAQRRIDQAQSDLETAQSAQITASDQIMSASMALSSGMPDPSASADLDLATQALNAARDAEADARRRLEQAQADLERAKQRGERAEQDAKDAARAAAGAFEGVAGGSIAAAAFGGSPTAIEGEVLARVRAGDYSVLETVPMNYLPEDTQRAIGAEMAKDSDAAATNDGDHSMDEMSDIVARYGQDEEVATGFYNQLGGKGARDFVSNMTFFHHQGEGWDNPELVQMMAPFATLLGTATRSGGLNGGFTGGFLRHDVKPRDRLGGHNELKAFVMAGQAENYSSDFLADVGREILIMPLDPANEDIPGHVEISEHQDLMMFVAGNPEAAGTLLAGRHGPENHFTNASALLNYGPRFTDDGEALGALITSGTHDLRYDNMALANDAAHAVIQSAPPYVKHLGDEAKPALVTILDDHIADVDYVAAEYAEAGIGDRPSDAIQGLTYDEAQKYLTALIGDGETRHPATTIVGERVAYDIHQGAVHQDTVYANRAGSLAQMGMLSTLEADLDTAGRQDTMDGLASGATKKLLALTPPGKVPGFDKLADSLLQQVFPADNVKSVLEQSAAEQNHLMGSLKRLTIAAYVEHGHLPEEALKTINPNGTLNVNFEGGPGGSDQDIVMRDGKPLEWDLDGDGLEPEEKRITERELYEATLGPGEGAFEGAIGLNEKHWAAHNPPDIDDLSVPDGFKNDDANFLEGVIPGDQGAEDVIESGGHVAARQEDLRWDPVEGVYDLPVESADGTKSELHYQHDGNKWRLVEKIGGVWENVD